MDRDIEILFEYNPRLRKVPALELKEMILFMERLGFSGRWEVVTKEDLYNFVLQPGSGKLMLCHSLREEDLALNMEIPKDVDVHVYALWRGTDGELVYFDSDSDDDNGPTLAVLEAWLRMGKPTLRQITGQWQGVGVGTCAYHMLSFIQFTCTHLALPSDQLTDLYGRIVGRSDFVVIQIV